jgi:nucleotide-binding universal stress UspA family protein
MTEMKALIPLDGTVLSETALHLGSYLKAIGCTSVRLVAVWEDIEDLPEVGKAKLGDAIEQGRAALVRYLDAKAGDLRKLGLEVIPVVHMGSAGDWILADAEEHEVDLVVIATHGRTGTNRWRLGSIADRVIRGANCPVLVVGPNVMVDMRTLAGRRIVVPLDGSEFAEEVLPVARHLVERLGCRLELVRVVTQPNSWSASPYITIDPAIAMDALEEGAKLYLDKVLPDMACRRSVIRSLLPGNVAVELTRYATMNGAGLIVMTSHARHGATRWLLGSVADEVLRGTSPVLLIKPGKENLGALFGQAKKEESVPAGA